MPDHLHLIWMGLRSASDQLNAMKFLRTHLEPALGQGREWQHQPHDHVLREEERQRSLRAPDVAPSLKTFKQKLFTGDRRRRRRLGRGRHDLHQLHLCRPADRGLTDVLGLDPTVPALTAVLVGSERIVQPKT